MRFFCCLVFLFLFSVSFVARLKGDVEVMLKRAVADKESIRQCEFEIENQFEGYVGKFMKWTRSIKIYMDGKQERFDFIEGDRVVVNLRHCPKDDDFAFFTSRPYGPLPSAVPDFASHLPAPVLAKLQLYPESERFKDANRNTTDIAVPTAHLIGSVPVSMIHQGKGSISNFSLPILSVLKQKEGGKLGGNSFSSSEDMLNGQKCIKVDCMMAASQEEMETVRQTQQKSIPPETSVTIWMSPEKGDSIVGVDVTFRLPNLVIERSQRSEVQWSEGGQQWFPVQWTYEEKRNGKNHISEKNSLKIVSMNKPIDPAIFTLQGIPYLEAGTPVEWNLPEPPPAEGDLVWDGKKIASAREAAEAALLDPARIRRMRVLVFGNIAFISLIVLSVLWNRYRKKNA